jgi:hypothetical protein
MGFGVPGLLISILTRYVVHNYLRNRILLPKRQPSLKIAHYLDQRIREAFQPDRHLDPSFAAIGQLDIGVCVIDFQYRLPKADITLANFPCWLVRGSKIEQIGDWGKVIGKIHSKGIGYRHEIDDRENLFKGSFFRTRMTLQPFDTIVLASDGFAKSQNSLPDGFKLIEEFCNWNAVDKQNFHRSMSLKMLEKWRRRGDNNRDDAMFCAFTPLFED